MRCLPVAGKRRRRRRYRCSGLYRAGFGSIRALILKNWSDWHAVGRCIFVVFDAMQVGTNLGNEAQTDTTWPESTLLETGCAAGERLTSCRFTFTELGIKAAGSYAE